CFLFLFKNLYNFEKKNIFFQSIVFTYAPFFSNISETTGATVPIFELDLTNVNTIILSHHSSKSVNAFESYRDNRRTDGQTKPISPSRAKTLIHTNKTRNIERVTKKTHLQ